MAFGTAALADLGVGARVGTLGLGIEATKSLVPMVNARGGFNFFSFGYDAEVSGVDYDATLSLRSLHLLADYHPLPLLGFRLSGGALINLNELEVVSQPAIQFTFGDDEIPFEGDDVGTVTGVVEFSAFAPYLGLGWGNAASSRIALALDLGVVFQGSPAVELKADGHLADDPTLRTSLEEEAANAEDDLSAFKFYPVASIGLSVKLDLL